MEFLKAVDQKTWLSTKAAGARLYQGAGLLGSGWSCFCDDRFQMRPIQNYQTLTWFLGLASNSKFLRCNLISVAFQVPVNPLG